MFVRGFELSAAHRPALPVAAPVVTETSLGACVRPPPPESTRGLRVRALDSLQSSRRLRSPPVDSLEPLFEKPPPESPGSGPSAVEPLFASRVDSEWALDSLQ